MGLSVFLTTIMSINNDLKKINLKKWEKNNPSPQFMWLSLFHYHSSAKTKIQPQNLTFHLCLIPLNYTWEPQWLKCSCMPEMISIAYDSRKRILSAIRLVSEPVLESQPEGLLSKATGNTVAWFPNMQSLRQILNASTLWEKVSQEAEGQWDQSR